MFPFRLERGRIIGGCRMSAIVPVRCSHRDAFEIIPISPPTKQRDLDSGALLSNTLRLTIWQAASVKV